MPSINVHRFEDDGSGGCRHCELPRMNRRAHGEPDTRPTPLRRPEEVDVAEALAAPVQVALDAPGTSHAAAAALLPRVGTRRLTMLDAIYRAGEHGMTDHDLEQHLGWSHQSASACRNSLMHAHVVEAAREWNGDPVKRALPNGNTATVWVVPERLRERVRAHLAEHARTAA